MDPAGGSCSSATTPKSGAPDAGPPHKHCRASRDLPAFARLPPLVIGHWAHPAKRDPGLGEDGASVLAPGSVELVYRWVSTIFKAAVGDRLIAAFTLYPDRSPQAARREVVPLTVDQVQALACSVPERYQALIVFAAGMGLRQGECFGLTVGPRRLPPTPGSGRPPARRSARAGVPEFGPPKSKAGFRTVPMPEVVGTALAAHLARSRGPLGSSSPTTSARPCVVAASVKCGTVSPIGRTLPEVGRRSTICDTSTPRS